MGIGPSLGSSYSAFDEPTKETPLGNPNPDNFEILKVNLINNHYIIKVKYPDCKNYEGVKILVFDEDVTITELINQDRIDPHFSDNKKFISPIARFEPTERGLEMAKKLCKNI